MLCTLIKPLPCQGKGNGFIQQGLELFYWIIRLTLHLTPSINSIQNEDSCF